MMLRYMWRSTRVRLTLGEDSGTGVELLRLATFIGFVTLMFRSMLDAKVYDWSYYFFIVVAVGASTLDARVPAPVSDQASAGKADSAKADRKDRAMGTSIIRPSVYRRNH